MVPIRSDPRRRRIALRKSHRLRGGGPILHNGKKAKVFAGPRQPTSAIPHRGGIEPKPSGCDQAIGLGAESSWGYWFRS
jgi:hypothetical protein